MITTTYYTTFEREVVPASGNSVNGRASTATATVGKVVASQAQTVATLPKQSAVATTGPVATQKLPTASGQFGIQTSLTVFYEPR